MSAAHNVKGKAKEFFNKFRESDKTPAPSSSSTKPLPPKPTEHLAHQFDALNIHPPPPSAPFVGGFKPPLPNMYATPGSPPMSMPMPMPVPVPIAPGKGSNPLRYGNGPTSLTMQHALNPGHNLNINPIHKPSISASYLPSPSYSFSPSPSRQSSPEKHPPKDPGNATNQAAAKPKRPRANSTPQVNVQTNANKSQCAATTKAGKPCTRQVKTGPALSSQIGDDDTDDTGTIERYCFQHSKELLGPSGFYARKSGVWVDYADWVPPYLQRDTQVALRVEMEKARSLSDQDGYIYTFEIRDPHSPNTIKFKVGRAVNLTKRIDEWSKQCKSKEQVLRGWYPGLVFSEDGRTPLLDHEISLMKGLVKAGEKGACCHRLERLIHLELADILSSGLYNDPTWPNVAPPTSSPSHTPKKSSGATQFAKCSDCGKKHKEIFEFTKVQRGHYVGREWEGIVKPIIEKWGGFVDSYV